MSQRSLANCRGYFPVLTVILTVISVVFFLLERGFHQLSPWLQDAVLFLAYLRLYPDPEQGLFHVGQVWGHQFLHGSWWHLLMSLALWLPLAIAVERRLGVRAVAAVFLMLPPLWVSVQLMTSLPGPDIGLILAGFAMAGVITSGFFRRAGARYSMEGGPRLAVVTSLSAIVFIGEGLRLMTLRLDGSLQGAAYPVVFVIMVLLAVIGGTILGRLWQARQPTRPRNPLRQIADGQADLDDLEQVLFQQSSIPLVDLAPIARRCIDEDRQDVARVLATYLALRDPRCETYQVLRAFLGVTQSQDSDA